LIRQPAGFSLDHQRKTPQLHLPVTHPGITSQARHPQQQPSLYNYVEAHFEFSDVF